MWRVLGVYSKLEFVFSRAYLLSIVQFVSTNYKLYIAIIVEKLSLYSAEICIQ